MANQYMVGLDVGSTTVKAVVAEAATDQIVWQDYQRHETKQPEKVLEFLRRIEEEAGVSSRELAAPSSPARAAARSPNWSARSSFRK